MKEEIRRIMNLVKEGKLSPEDAAELIDAFSKESQEETSEGNSHSEETTGQSGEKSGPQTPPPPPEDSTQGKSKDPFRGFVDIVEGLEKQVRESVDWKKVADQVREGTNKGFEGLKSSFEQIKTGNFSFSAWASSETKVVELPLIVSEEKTLRIENPVGNIKVVGGASSGYAKATAKVRGSDDMDARMKADGYTLIIEESDHEVLIRQPDMAGTSVDLELSIEGKCAVEIHTGSGDVRVENTGKGCRINTQSGDTFLKGLNGPVDVTCQSGDLRIDNSSTTMMTIESTSGDITLYDVKGMVRARSASGDVALKECAGKSVSVESVSGNVSIDLVEPITGSLNVRNVNGNASIAVPDGSDCRVSLSTLRGHVHSSIELEDEAKTETHLTGKIGEGAGTLDVSAVNGDVSLALRLHSAV
ncbi:MAG: DUF4097 family beta strand repeat protein [Fimbriimonadaceae bacterium]|nr:DUF4097 family beta strand repeat protein [Fimbriimonadaceae bacterium]